MAVTVLSKSTGTELQHVSFNSGGEALTALLGGHVHASLGNPLEFMGHLQVGHGARASACSATTASPCCPTCRP